MLWAAPSLLHTVSQQPVGALLMRENRSHNDVSAAVVFMQHNALTTAIHVAFADAGLFHFEFLKTICVCTCVWKCEDVCPLRGAWVTERFIPSACLSKRCCGQGHLRWQWMGCGRGSGIKGLLARSESGSFSLWQREVTGRQRTGDRRTASQRHLHSFRTAAYPCTKNTPSRNALHPRSHTLSYTHTHKRTRTHMQHTDTQNPDSRIDLSWSSHCLYHIQGKMPTAVTTVELQLQDYPKTVRKPKI